MSRRMETSGMFLVMLAASSAAVAQEGPAPHSGATSAPLFVQDLPAGSISVRITRPSMAEPLTKVRVVGTWTTSQGKQGSASVDTGEDGRAVFTGVPTGSSFTAKAQVEGQQLSTTTFTVPDEGGTRLLMIVGAEADDAMADMTGAPHAAAKPVPNLSGLRAGTVEAKDGEPAGTLAIRVSGPDGKPVPDLVVSLGHTGPSTKQVESVHAKTDQTGTARFADLATSPDTHYVAVVDQPGVRLGTAAFSLDSKRGSVGEIRIPARTTDLSVLRISAESRMMIELREDSVGLLQNLIVENESDKIFDPGPRGLFLPLPTGCSGTEKLPGGSEVQIKDGEGVFLSSPVPPTQNLSQPVQVRVGCNLQSQTAPQVEIVQPMTLEMQGALVMVPADYPIRLAAPGLVPRAAESDETGLEMHLYDLAAVAPGQALRLTVDGIPTRPQTGKWIAAALVCILVAAGIIGSRRPRSGKPASA